MAREKKINPNAQAPNLIKKIQRDLKWTQTDLERTLGIRQQAVSDYLAGFIWREQYRVLNTLTYILANKLPPPPETPEEVINFEKSNDSTAGTDDKGKSKRAKKKSSSVVSARRISGNQRRDR